MSVPATLAESPAPAFADGQPRRLHPLTLVMALLRVGPQSLNILPGIIALGVTGRAEWIVPGLALFLAVSALTAWLKWLRFSWSVDADDIAIASGIFSRNSRTIPFDRIQDVAIEQGLLARMLGIATVSFDTGSAEADGKEEGKLRSIALDEAEALRDHIRARRTGRAALPVAVALDGQAIDAQPVPPAAMDGYLLFAMTPKRLVIAGLFNFSLAIFAVLIGLLNTFDTALPFDPFDFDIWVDLARRFGLESWVLGHRWLALIGGGFTILLLGIATGIVRTAIREGNFRLERNPRGFRRTRGLTTRTDVTIPLARVQAGVVETGIIRRWFGWHALKLQSLASDTKEEADHMIAPLATLAEVDQLLAELSLDRAGFEDRSGDAQWHASHSVGIWLVPSVIAALAAPVALVMLRLRPDLWWAPLVPLAVASVMLGAGWFAWRHRRWSFDGRLLHITSGFFKRQHIILPARNIQSADLTVGPLTRRLGLAGLTLGVAGGSSGGHAIADIPVEQARVLRTALLAVRA